MQNLIKMTTEKSICLIKYVFALLLVIINFSGHAQQLKDTTKLINLSYGNKRN